MQPEQCWRGSMQTTAVLVVERTTKYDDLANFAECGVSSDKNEKPTPSPCTRRNPTSGGRTERNCARRSVQRYDVIQLQLQEIQTCITDHPIALCTERRSSTPCLGDGKPLQLRSPVRRCSGSSPFRVWTRKWRRSTPGGAMACSLE